MMARSARSLPLFIAVVMVLTGCGRMRSEYPDTDGARIRFAISLQPDEARAVSELVKRFEARTNTGVSLELFTRLRDQSGATVTVEPVGSGGMKELLRKEGSKIHLFAQDNGDLADLVRTGAVQPVPDIHIPEEVPESMRPEGDRDGTRWFVPFRPNVRITYANKEAFARAGVEPPATVADFERVARTLKARNPDTPAKVSLSLSRADDGAPTSVTISELVLSFGGRPELIDDAQSVEAFSFLQMLFRDDLLAWESLLGKHDTEVDYLKDGAVWLAQNWSVTSASLRRAGALDSFLVHPGWQTAHVVGGDVLGIPNRVTGKERKAAVALAEFLMTRESQAFLVQRNAWPAIRDDAYDLIASTPTIEATRRALERGWYRPTAPYWDDVVWAMNEAVRRVVFGHQDPGTVLRELRQEVERRDSSYPRKDQ
jgi:trehalose transport system substrate-binding protein